MKKLNLNKETLQVLRNDSMDQVDGAAWNLFSLWGDLCNGHTGGTTYAFSICYIKQF